MYGVHYFQARAGESGPAGERAKDGWMTNTAMRPGPRGGGVPPTREPEPNPGPGRAARSGLVSLLALPGQGMRSVIKASATTPGRLSLIAVGLVALALLTGLAGTIMAQTKRDVTTDLLERREPLVASAQQVYRALSDADATAASAFLSAGREPEELRARYENNIAQAGVSLTKAASDVENTTEAATSVDVIAKYLPVYTGLVETARANNRLGYPAGASYLREASDLMASKILPAAERLYELDTERLEEEQDDASSFPWLTALLVIGLIAALIVTQRYLTRRTNRVINVGLMVATVAVLFGLLWTSIALVAQGVLMSGAREDGTEQVNLLVKARIAALQARAGETLTLVARGDGGKYEEDWKKLSTALAGPDGKSGLLGEVRGREEEDTPAAGHIDSAMKHVSAWFKAHDVVTERNQDGKYADAVRQVIDGSTPTGSATTFKKLDSDLHLAINAGRQSFFDDTTNGSRALLLLPFGWALIGIVAALGIAVGIRERLREYR